METVKQSKEVRTMSRNTVAIAGFALLLGAAAARPAHAMTDEELVKAHVPFAFRVSGEQMPAGDYQIKPLGITLPGVLEIRRTGGGPAAVCLTIPESGRSIEHARMVFDDVGNQRFLRAILLPGEDGVELPVVGAEIRAARAVAAEASHSRSASVR
jgi:hypothetical protein